MNDFVKKRKIRYALLAVTGLVLLGIILTAAGGLFGAPGAETVETSVKAPLFSEKSGFYDDELTIKIKGPKGTRIYYTLDGSLPDETSTEYTGPIKLGNATSNENVYSMRTDVSAGFYEDLIEKYSGLPAEESAPGYKQPEEPVDKCNIVRAIAVDELGRASDVTSGTYFVGIKASDYDDCGIISLIADPDDLFDHEKGIYVTGDVFDKYKNTDAIKNYHGIRWRYWDANYTQHGRDWEREASMEFFDKNGDLQLHKNTGIRIHGGCSRGPIPKSLGLFARKSYDGDGRFEYEFFDDGFDPSSMILSCGGSEPLVQCCDYMMASLLKDSDVDFATMRFRPYVMFIDGEYWGFYWLETRYDAAYCENYYGVDKDNVILIKEGEVSSGEEEHKGLYTHMKETITDGDMSVKENYERACELIDIDSYIDYYAVQIYIARAADWPSKNFSLWRTVNTSSDQYSDGKWRWMLFDSDSQALKVRLVDHNTLDYVLEKDAMFASLWKNETFRGKFEKRIMELADSCFNDERVDTFFEDFTEPMYARMAKSWRRFYGSDNGEQEEYFYGKLDSYHQFFRQRKAVVKSWFS